MTITTTTETRRPMLLGNVALAALLAAVAFSSTTVVAMNPPFSGTAFLSTSIITEADSSTFDGSAYVGMGDRWVFDRRVNRFVFQSMHLFDATFSDGLVSEIQVNPVDFIGQSTAAVEAERYGLAVGRLPTSMRTDVDSITIHKGVEPFGGGNRNLLIHTGQAEQYGGYLEEILFHEAAHTSYDEYHDSAPGWLAAQQSDPAFISTYARDNPNREDVAESLLPWYALRYTDALFPFQVEAINAAIPARLAYFDSLPFELNPVGIAGDYNGDGSVDAADYTVWRDTENSTTDLRADGDGDGQVGGADYAVWRDNYRGVEAEAAGVSVPEPASAAAAFFLLTLAASGKQSRGTIGATHAASV